MSRPASAATWVCPICGRRVPRRESECFCGAKQQAAEQHHRTEQKKKSTRVPLDVALLALAVVLIGVYAVHRVTQEAPELDAGAAAVGAALRPPEPPPALAAPPLPARTPSPAPADAGATQRAPDPPLPPLQTPPPLAIETAPPPAAAAPTPTPTPSATPTPFDERAQVRAAGLAAYESALQRLAGAASRLETLVRDYRTHCGSGEQRMAAVSNCGEIEATIGRELLQIEKGLDAAEDDARRSWVQPGDVRNARGRSPFGTRQWDETVNGARNLRR